MSWDLICGAVLIFGIGLRIGYKLGWRRGHDHVRMLFRNAFDNLDPKMSSKESFSVKE
jgi:hypothetical protein